MDTILGIDVAKANFDVCLLTPTQSHSATFDNTSRGIGKLQRWLKRHQVEQLHACLEATGHYGQLLANALYAAGYRVSMVNPKRIYNYAHSKLRRAKTDRQDAQLLADFCLTQKPTLWMPASAEQQELQELTRHLENLKSSRTRCKNQLKSGRYGKRVRQSVEEQIGFLDRQIKQLEEEIERLVQQSNEHAQQVELLTSIPGIGPLTAAKFIAEVPDIHRFQHADQLAAYAGLVPKITQSGASKSTAFRLDKTGNRFLRTALYMPALNAHRFNPVAAALADRLKAKGKHGKTIIAAVMRKLITLAYGVLKSGRPFDPLYHANHIQP